MYCIIYETSHILQVFSIDMATNERKSLKPMLTARWGHSTVTLDGSIYAIGGYDENSTPLGSAER